MKEQNNIEELFRDKLQNIEADPGINAWANVQAGLSTVPATVVSTSYWASTVIVAVTITAIAVGGYFFFNKEGEKKNKNIESPIIQPTESSVQEKTMNETGNLDPKDIEKVNDSNKEASTTKEEVSPTLEKNANNSLIEKKETRIIENENSVSEISEKTIDEIIAEHQASLNLNGNSIDNDENSNVSEESTDHLKANNLKKTTPTEDSDYSDKNSSDGLTEKEQNKLITDLVIFPNVFSPNGDGSNDIFVIDMENSIPIDNIKVSIFDKTGKLVNEWSGLYNGWDGKYKDGSIAKKDSYIYKAIILKDNKEYLKVNSFTLFY